MKTMPETSDFEFLTSHNTDENDAKNQDKGKETSVLYQKCLNCPDYGTTCNGPKLAALGDIMIVRNFHRSIRDTRGIPMKLIYLAAAPISESTINDYFSHSVKDFKWTTVGCIDNALTAICGNRVGKPLLDHPCPASSTEIQEQINLYSGEIETLKTENIRLQEKVAETKGKVISTREEVKEDYASRVQFLKELCERRQSDIDELKASHSKEVIRLESVASDYLSRIDEKNRRIDMITRVNHFLIFFLVITLILLTSYLVWDLVHPSAGLFQY